MKKATFEYQGAHAELAMTRDPESQEWLAAISLHLEERSTPAVLGMDPLNSQVSEDDAWHKTTQWAGDVLPRWWMRLSTPNG